MTREIKLALHLDPATPTDLESGEPPMMSYVKTAQKAEAALFDAIFRADSYTFSPENLIDVKADLQIDPLIAFAGVTGFTQRIGLVATASTTFNAPYQLSRQFLTLDMLSGGRVGWNAVTSFMGEEKFGLSSIPNQETRYEIATEFVEIVHRLWDSWPKDAFHKTEKGFFIDAKKISVVDFVGKHLKMKGASDLPRSPQGRPVQFQAGASGQGKAFGARFADVIFSASPDFHHATEIYQEFKNLARSFNRHPDHLLITPGFQPVLASTEQEARDIFYSRTANVNYTQALKKLEFLFGGVDYSDLSLDEPIPAHRLPDTSQLTRRQSRPELFKRLALEKNTVLRDVLYAVYHETAHYTTFGSYDQITDELIHWFDNGAADGFVLVFKSQEDQLDAFIEHVIPRLQDRGYFRKKYTATTLRGHLGLPEM